jgi:precorrin-2 dehydrogenase / sirohydrochlorin ferrochelatase
MRLVQIGQSDMFPIALNISKLPLFLIGEGEAFEKRKIQLTEVGALQFFSCHFADWESEYTQAHWQKSPVIMVVGLAREHNEMLVAAAHAHHKIINVEDVMDLCDFYFMSTVRRGDLVIAVSTSGASPTLAKKVRDVIAQRFGAEWSERTQILADMRTKLKASGASMKEIMAKTETFLAEKGWFS